ncbi:hypothetical protein IMSHALPRED_002300 [Imshaugia aleurites]|uniref:Uncharacterized protein n=1 Tax=Imshaugia aleurites TaxID=172621 RepID=A0A8H3F0K2_9LECA|nr:hypothetical protein IMSHALPRED_002300 [Imshaugia aleurites]
MVYHCRALAGKIIPEVAVFFDLNAEKLQGSEGLKSKKDAQKRFKVLMHQNKSKICLGAYLSALLDDLVDVDPSTQPPPSSDREVRRGGDWHQEDQRPASIRPPFSRGQQHKEQWPSLTSKKPLKQRQTPITKGIQTQHNLGDREEVNEAEAADVWGTIDFETCAPGLENFRQCSCIMAQEPDFCLNLTDGDVTHTPTPAELQKGYTQADAVSTLTALEILAK